MNKQTLFLLLLSVFYYAGCGKKSEPRSMITLKDIFRHPPLTLLSITQAYQSHITAASINDMDESILCVSSRISEQSTTYFIQQDSIALKDLSFKYEDASIVDMKVALLILDTKSGKETLFYLPGRFPIDSMDVKPDAIIPVLGISKYYSKLEKISSRWTEIVCKCSDRSAGPVIYKNRTIDQCDTGGKDKTECALTTEGSFMSCQTECRAGANACCWFEF